MVTTNSQTSKLCKNNFQVQKTFTLVSNYVS